MSKYPDYPQLDREDDKEPISDYPVGLSEVPAEPEAHEPLGMDVHIASSEVLPVRVVQEDTRETRTARPFSVPVLDVAQQPVRICSANPRRGAITITNTHATIGVRLMVEPTDTVAMGYPLNAGQSIRIVTQDTLFAARLDAAPTTTVELGAVDEMSVRIEEKR